MSFAENAKKIVSDTADNVVKASSELIENSKLKYKIYDAGIDKKRLFEKLGKLVYAEYMGNVELSGEKDELCSEIREIEAYIEAMKEKLEK